MIIKLSELDQMSDGKYVCPYCQKIYGRHGIATHIWRNHTEEGKNFNPDPNIGYKNGTRTAWNKGLTKETDKRVAQIGKTLTERYATGEIVSNCHKQTEEAKEKIRQARKKVLSKKGKMPNKKKSYHENRIIRLLKENNIQENYVNNYKISYKEEEKTKTYWYDVAFPDLLIDIETDGWEHEIQNHVESDQYRDYLSIKYGWNVLRLKNKEIKDWSDDQLLSVILDEIEKAKVDIEERKLKYEKNPYLHKKKSKTVEQMKQERIKLTEERVEKIKKANIDFSVWKWRVKVAEILNMSPSKAAFFVKTYMPEIYETCKKHSKKEP